MSERKTSVFVSPGFPAFYFPDILWFLAQQIVLCSRLIPRLPSSSFPFTFTLFNLISCLSPPHNLLFADQQFSTAITNQFFSPFPFSFLTTLLPFFLSKSGFYLPFSLREFSPPSIHHHSLSPNSCPFHPPFRFPARQLPLSITDQLIFLLSHLLYLFQFLPYLSPLTFNGFSLSITMKFATSFTFPPSLSFYYSYLYRQFSLSLSFITFPLATFPNKFPSPAIILLRKGN